MPPTDVFPMLQSCAKITDCDRLYDVKFYPYGLVDDDYIFAALAELHTFICRPKLGSDPPFEVLRWWKDSQDDTSFNCLEWTKDPVTSNPWLCIAGHNPKTIKILDVASGKIVRDLVGHGKGINDLAISPLSTNILASGAEDDTIRLWNLQPSYKKQPCVALFGGGAGHKSPILAIRFHPNGKWLLSGGIDTAVCLWAVPSLDELARKDDVTAYPTPVIVYYPHFFSKEVHSNYVDCVEFYGDMIFSKAAKSQDGNNKANEIILWRIDGFNPSDPPPTEPPIPKPGYTTRSSFQHNEKFRGFQRVLTLSMPYTDRFYHRFALLHRPNMRPILTMGNQQSRYSFWDLQRLEEGMDPREVPHAKKGRGKKVKVGISAENLNRLGGVKQSSSTSVASGTSGVEVSDYSETSSTVDRVYTLDDRFKPLVPHHTKVANTKLSPNSHFATSQMGWSPDGTWLIGVGDYGMMCFFHRDKSAR